MKRKYAFILAILITFVIAFNFYSFEKSNSTNEVYVSRVIDGDTFEFGEDTARLVNINTPEKSEKGYQEAKDFLSQIENSTVRIEEISRDKYGRLLVRVYSPEYINLEIVEKGLATKFLVQESELNEFDEAEKKAIDNGQGIWEKSPLYGCFKLNVNAEEEYVWIKNNCEKTNLKGFTIRDESRKRYKFQSIDSSVITLHTSEGVNTNSDLFWDVSGGVWNNDRDTAYFLDASDKIVSYHSYGY